MSELENYKRIAETQKRSKAKSEGKLETLYEELGEQGHTSLDSAKGDMIFLQYYPVLRAAKPAK